MARAETDDGARTRRTRRIIRRPARVAIDAARSIRLGLAFEKTRDLFELAANLGDHVEGRVTDRVLVIALTMYGDAADEHADENHRVVDRKNEVRVTADLGDVADQGQCGSAAALMAKPLPMAAVVPTSSSESVISRVSGPISAISAMPPALSAARP